MFKKIRLKTQVKAEISIKLNAIWLGEIDNLGECTKEELAKTIKEDGICNLINRMIDIKDIDITVNDDIEVL